MTDLVLPASRRMPALYVSHGAPPLMDDALWPGQLADWAKRFTTLFSQSIYKWVQSPLSLHVGSLDLDRERALQMPVVQKNEW